MAYKSLNFTNKAAIRMNELRGVHEVGWKAPKGRVQVGIALRGGR